MTVDLFPEGSDKVHSLAVSKTDQHVAVGCRTRFGLYSIKGRTWEWLDAPEVSSSKAEAQAMAFSSMGGVFAVVTLHNNRMAQICVFNTMGAAKFSSSLYVPEKSTRDRSKVSDRVKPRRAIAESVLTVAELPRKNILLTDPLL
jgi:hypothetical protein